MRVTKNFFIPSFIGVFLLILVLPLNSFAAYYPTKDEVGLNVHWTLGGFNLDNLYDMRLSESKTRWVREHFYTEVFFSGNNSWDDRYENVLKKYRSKNIRIVGMLAYGPEHGNFLSPDPKKWEEFVDYMVRRFGRYVKVWEVWNEPDSPDYLRPNTADNYIPILEIAYNRIKKIDPDAKVLAAGMTSPNPGFADELYSKTNKFDALSFHLYYCGWYRDAGNHDKLINDLNSLKGVINKHQGSKAWVTEIGCSTGSYNIDENFQQHYLSEAIPLVMESGFVERILIYNIRNYTYGDPYEDNFGLLDSEMKPRKSWYWYKKILIGPYNKLRIPLSEEQNKALELRAKLEKYFGEGLIPVSAANWPTLVNAYIYGEYPVQAIVQAIRYGGKTVHPQIPYYLWKEKPEYQEYINKDWTGGMIIFAYGLPRILITDEQAKASELKNLLQQNYDFGTLRITIENWGTLVNAYVYGGYPLEAIARAYTCNGAVSFEIPYNSWKVRGEHITCMQ